MKLHKRILENKFFLKLLFTYCLIIIVGLSLAVYFININVADNLLETESRYEREIIQKVKDNIEETFKTIDKIFIQFYLGNNSSPSITDLINYNKSLNITEDEKKRRINNFVQTICNANNFISDIMLIEYTKNEVYFYSNELNRDMSLSYDFFNSDFFHKIEGGTNSRSIIPNYMPEYIINNTNGLVITVFINLYDANYIIDDRKIGAVAININPKLFGKGYKDVNSTIKGKILVMNQSGFVFFDSSDELTEKNFHYKDCESLEELISKNSGNVFINKLESESTDLVYVNIIEKSEVYKEIRKSQGKVLNIIVICLLLTIIINIFASRIFTRRIKDLVKSMKSVEMGSFDSQIRVGADDEIGYLEKSFNNMCTKLDNYIKTVYISEIKAKTAELKALQAQINPHFFFNTLESIRIIALLNKDNQAAKMIHILGNMFRWSIKMKGLIVEISDEIEYINSYIEMQKMRYDNKFDVDIKITKEILNLGIPKLILQPIIENAIYHGISSSVEEGKIVIRGMISSDKKVVIKVIDNGMGMDKDKIDEQYSILNDTLDNEDLYKIGLKNVQQRLRILFGVQYGLSLSSEQGKGMEVCITIPALSKEEMESYV